MIKICAFGDSVLRGVVLDGNRYRHLKECFVNLVSDKLNADIKNNGKFGSTILTGEKSLERNLKQLEDDDSKYVIMEFGGNDCDFNWKEISENPDKVHRPNTEISEFSKVYTKTIEKIKAMKKRPVLLSLPPIDAKKYFNKISEGLNAANILKWLGGNKQHITDWHERYNIETFKIAIANGVPIIDITSKFLEAKDYSALLCDDGIHPNEKGHKLIAETIMQYISDNNVVFAN